MLKEPVLTGLKITLEVPNQAVVTVADGQHLIRLGTEGTLEFRGSGERFVSFSGGRLSLSPAISVAIAKGSNLTDSWSVRPSTSDTSALSIVDDEDRELFRLDHIHSILDWPVQRLLATDMDVRIGPHLASLLSDMRLQGHSVGVAHLRLAFRAPPGLQYTQSDCEPPRWPNEERTVDVTLSEISALQADCGSTPACGGRTDSIDAVVKLTPSVRLANSGTADVSWYRMFNPVPGDSPYVGIDQHPFLAWNAYRLDSDGTLVPLGHSGVKHAVVSVNAGCSCANPQILGVGCSDVYGNSSNDNNVDLGSRDEVIAREGRWARCGSFFDRSCSGQRGSGTYIGSFDHRLVIPERVFADAPKGSRFFLEAWYVVRDDVNLENSFATVEFRPEWTGSLWLTSLVLPRQSGPMIDLWPELSGSSRKLVSSTIDVPEGRIRVVSRVTPLGRRRFLYEYAVMNLDFGVTRTEGIEPNLRMSLNRGPTILRVPTGRRVVATRIRAVDASSRPTLPNKNPSSWSWSREDDRLVWRSASDAGLTWGKMVYFSFQSTTEAADSSIDLSVGSGDEATSLKAAALAPVGYVEPPRAEE